MENSLEYTIFIRDFVENILLSLNMDYRNYISFNKKGSLLKEKVDCHNLDKTISYIAYNLLIKGKQEVYFYSKDGKIIISTNYDKEENMIDKIRLRFPRKIMSNLKRRKILNRLKRMNCLRENNYKDNNYAKYNLFIMELIKKDSEKLTKDYSAINSNIDKYTDQYILYREIRKRKNQKILVSYIFNKINKTLHRYLNITDNDNLVFVSQTLEELDLIESDLINNKKTINESLKAIYPNRIK